MRTFFFLFVLVLFSIISCTELPVPKPRGFIRFDLPKHEYKRPELPCPFTFDIPKNGVLRPDAKDCYYTLWIPEFKGEVFITYHKLNEDQDLQGLLDGMHEMAYQHQIKASSINTRSSVDSEKNKYVLEYLLEGNVASSYQFCITDSTDHFFRGALYFRAKPNQDSILPVRQYVQKDLEHLISSFSWK